MSQVLMTYNCHRSGPKQDLPGRLSGDFRIHKLEKIVGGGEGKKKYPARQRANRPTNELTKQTHTCANTVSATNPIFVNEISSPPLHTCI